MMLLYICKAQIVKKYAKLKIKVLYSFFKNILYHIKYFDEPTPSCCVRLNQSFGLSSLPALFCDGFCSSCLLRSIIAH